MKIMSSKTRRFAGKILSIAMISSAFIGVSAPIYAAEITARMDGDFDTLDPHKTVSTDRSFFIIPILYQRLFRPDANGAIVPVIAESYSVSAAQLDVVIREGVMCSNGHELTASDVARSLMRLVAPDTNSPSLSRLGGREGFTATGDDASRSVTIVPKQPIGSLLAGLALTSSSIICPEGLDNPDRLLTESFGTGRYQIDPEHFRRGIEYGFNLRADQAPEAGRPERITVRIIENATTAANELLSGGVDIATLRGRDEDRLQGRIPGASIPPWGATVATLQHNEGHSTAELAVRQAVFLAIDRKAALIAGSAGRGEVASSFVGSSIQCFTSDTNNYIPETSIDEARKVLEAAGWALNSGGAIYEKDGAPLRLRILTQATSTNSLGEYLLSTLQKLGAEVTLKLATPEEVVPLSKTDTWDVRVTTMNNASGSADGMHVFFKADSSLNTSNVNNEGYNAATDVASAMAPNDPEYCSLWAKAQIALLSNFDALPLYSAYDTIYHREGLAFDFIIPSIPDLSSVVIAE